MLSSLRLSAFLVSFVFLLACFDAHGLKAQEPPPAPAKADLLVQAAQKRIQRELERRTDWDFVDTQLGDVFKLMSDRLGVNFHLDAAALEKDEIGTDASITLSVTQIPTGSVLSLILDEHDLGWTIRDGRVIISTKDVLENSLSTRTFPVADLVRLGGAEGQKSPGIEVADESRFDYDTLVAAIVNTVEPSSWDALGGLGSIKGIDGTIVVDQVRSVNEKVNRLLIGCRAILQQLEQHPERIPEAISINESDPRIRRALAKPASIDFQSTTMKATMERFSHRFEIPIVFDRPALEDYGIGTDTPLSLQRLRVRELPLGRVLQVLLQEHDLTFLIRHDVLMVTTREAAEVSLDVRLYPVGDLVAPSGVASADCTGGGCDFDRVIGAIQQSVAPESWDFIGGPGAIAALQRPAVLCIAQTEQVHIQVAELMDELRRRRKREQE